MDNQELKEFMASKIEAATALYSKDFEAIDPSALDQSLGGSARCAYDFTYEVVFVNKRIAERLRGEDPAPFNFEGWIVAPDEFRSQKVALEELVSSSQAVADALRAFSTEKLADPIATPTGETSGLKAAMMALTHLTYHDAQLNYIQSLLGDDEMHWN